MGSTGSARRRQEFQDRRRSHAKAGQLLQRSRSSVNTPLLLCRSGWGLNTGGTAEQRKAGLGTWVRQRSRRTVALPLCAALQILIRGRRPLGRRRVHQLAVQPRAALARAHGRLSEHTCPCARQGAAPQNTALCRWARGATPRSRRPSQPPPSIARFDSASATLLAALRSTRRGYIRAAAACRTPGAGSRHGPMPTSACGRSSGRQTPASARRPARAAAAAQGAGTAKCPTPARAARRSAAGARAPPAGTGQLGSPLVRPARGSGAPG